MKQFLWALAACVAMGSASALERPATDPRVISVSGQGEVSVKPDRARVSMGVEAVNADLKTAEAEVNRVVRAFIAESKVLGIAEADVSTAGINIAPEYIWLEKERRNQLVGYRVSRDLEVMLRDLDKVGDLMLRATRAGVNRVNSPQLESSRSADLTRQALVKATEDARAKAKLLADTLAVKLGPVLRLNAQDAAAPPPYPMVKAMAVRSDTAESGNQEMGFSAGEIRYAASVSADFELIVP